jgi:ABC-type antimicrobial peptide transport system ATPase subunit
LNVSNEDYVQTQQSVVSGQNKPAVQPNLDSAAKSIDLNNFSDEDKNMLNQTVEGLAEKVSQEILKNGHFLSFQDFSSRMNLQPHEIAKLQTVVTFSQKENPTPKNSGRILDI